MTRKKTNQSGLTLLVVVLVATVLITIGLSISNISTEETKIARLEKESKEAFAAAEAGIDAAIGLNPGETFSNFSTLGLEDNITGTATVTEVQNTSFTIPVIGKDEQYTFYFSAYSPSLKQITGPASTDSFKIHRLQPLSSSYCSDNNGDSAFAVELTLLNREENRVIARKLIDTCNMVDDHPEFGAVDQIDFDQEVDLSALPAHVMIIRVIAPSGNFGGTQLQVINSESPQNNWPAQGKTITSKAENAASGVSKTVELFQSYPQIPADFFVTSF